MLCLPLKMEERHKRAIRDNFVSLVETTDLDSMVTALYQRGVFSEQMIEAYKVITLTPREMKSQLYRDIQRRGPLAFGRLMEVLEELGYWDLVRELDPNSPLHLRTRRTNIVPPRLPNVQNTNSFISISEKKNDQRQKTKTEGEAQRNAPATASVAPDVLATATAGAGATATNNNIEKPTFVVNKSTKFIEDNESKDIRAYRTRGKNRGVALLFTYMTFDYNIESVREGVEVDVVNLKHLFQELGFSVLAYMDLTLEESRNTLLGLEKVLGGCESVFVVISSHGHERPYSTDTDVRCRDGGLLSLREIISYFSNSKMPQLSNVPKVFVFQNCRGSNTDFIMGNSSDRMAPPPLSMPLTDVSPSPPGSDPPPRPASPENRLSKMPLYSNILIAQSTLPGMVSRRDSKFGSWYIQAMCAVFAERAHDTHVDKLFTLVDKWLLEKFHIQTSSVDRWGFNRRLYLHPGLHE